MERHKVFDNKKRGGRNYCKMSNQGEDGWYPECDDCGCGNLAGSITFCTECWNKIKKKYKIKEDFA